MPLLPLAISNQYRPATDREVRAWSFGQVHAPRQLHAVGWEERQGTLDDPAIFGPDTDWECGCGMYSGAKHKGLICDRCGVKVTSRATRRERFGHIELQAAVPHPLGNGAGLLAVVPVLPAAFLQSSGGLNVARTYDDVLSAVRVADSRAIIAGLDALIEELLPVLRMACEWDLQDAGTLARGLALERRTDGSDGRCANCGYPLVGLALAVCPGCGASLAAS